MRTCSNILLKLLTPALLLTVSASLAAANESKFFLQDDGEVRVLRGLNADRNFEAATLPEEIPLAPAAAPADVPAEARREVTQTGPKFTRQEALRRARERGIPVDRAGVRKTRLPNAGQNRREAIARARARGIPIIRATNTEWRPFASRDRGTIGITTNRATNLGWSPYRTRDDRLSRSSSGNRTSADWAPQRSQDVRLVTSSNDHLLWPPINTKEYDSTE